MCHGNHVHCLNWVAVSWCVPMSRLIQVSTLNICSRLYLSYTSRDLFKNRTSNFDTIVVHM